MGIDPGKTTGYCICLCIIGAKPLYLTSGTVDFSELGLAELEMYTSLIVKHRVDEVIIEDVIKSGQMNVDKFIQIRAYERAFIAANTRKVCVEVQSAQHTKACKVAVPVEAKGKHAKDAYRIVAAKLQKFYSNV